MVSDVIGNAARVACCLTWIRALPPSHMGKHENLHVAYYWKEILRGNSGHYSFSWVKELYNSKIWLWHETVLDPKSKTSINSKK